MTCGAGVVSRIEGVGVSSGAVTGAQAVPKITNVRVATLIVHRANPASLWRLDLILLRKAFEVFTLASIFYFESWVGVHGNRNIPRSDVEKSALQFYWD
jgi:hypothetical protein